MIGFAITACVLSATLLIISAISLAEFSRRLHCPKNYSYNNYNYQYGYRDSYGCYNYSLKYYHAQVGAALGSLLLILAVVEFFVALASSIYGCNACCTSPSVQVCI
jgi:hypothetical protein